MTADGAVRFSDLVAAMERRGTPLATETALFVLLETATSLADDPRAITADAIELTADGDVRIDARVRASEERAAIDALGRLMDRYVMPMTPGVRGLLNRARAGDVRSVSSMAAEIQALLVPLNRAAARRVTGRLVREHERAASKSSSEPAEPSVSADALYTRERRSDDATSDPVGTAVDTQPEGPPASIPPIPPPPRLGSLASLAARSSADPLDTEPDAPLARANDADDLPQAESTTLDGAYVAPRAVSPTVRRVVIAALILAIAGIVVALWLGHALPVRFLR